MDGIVSTLLEKFIWFSVFVKQYNIFVFAFFTILLLFIRFRLSNRIVIKRKETTNWVIFGILMIANILSFFIKVASISMIINIIMLISIALIIIFTRNSKKIAMINGAVLSSDLAFDTGSGGPSKMQKLWEGEAVALEKAAKNVSGPSVIKHSLAFSSVTMISGTPVFTHTFKWVMNIAANKEQYYYIQSQIAQFFKDYNWIGNKKGKYFVLTAYPKSSKTIPFLPFNEKLSSEMPWYCVPLGSIDTINAKKTDPGISLYYWLLHDDKMEFSDPIVESSLLKNNVNKDSIFEAPMGLIAGGTGGGKSVLLKTAIAHWINTNEVDLYLSDPKGGAEFGTFKEIPCVKEVATDLTTSYNIFKNFTVEMNKRYLNMGKLGINKLPLDGEVNLTDTQCIMVNGNVFKFNEAITACTNLTFEASKNMSMEDIKEYLEDNQQTIEAQYITNDNWIKIPANNDLGLKAHWEYITADGIQRIGTYIFRPMIFISDEYAQLVSENTNMSNRQLEAIDEIKFMVESIARLGRAANIHLLIATQAATNSLFPASLKNNLHFRTICGAVTQDISRMIIGTEEGETIPAEPNGMYLSYCKNNTTLYRGFFTTAKDIQRIASKYSSEEENKMPSLILEIGRTSLDEKETKTSLKKETKVQIQNDDDNDSGTQEISKANISKPKINKLTINKPTIKKSTINKPTINKPNISSSSKKVIAPSIKSKNSQDKPLTSNFNGSNKPKMKKLTPNIKVNKEKEIKSEEQKPLIEDLDLSSLFTISEED